MVEQFPIAHDEAYVIPTIKAAGTLFDERIGRESTVDISR